MIKAHWMCRRSDTLEARPRLSLPLQLEENKIIQTCVAELIPGRRQATLVTNTQNGCTHRSADEASAVILRR